MFKVYLAGPIAGLTFDTAQDWRSTVSDLLEPDIKCYSPLRNKGFLRSSGVIGVNPLKSVMATDQGIMTRDHWDCMTADLVFFNFLGATEKSTGTIMEMAWAFAYRKPTVVAMEKSGNIHDHPMMRQAINYHVDTLTEAASVTRAILLNNI